MSKGKNLKGNKKPAPIVAHLKLAAAAAASSHNRPPPTHSPPTHCWQRRPLYGAILGGPPPHHPPVNLGNGSRPGEPEAATSSRLTTGSMLTAAAAIGHKTRPPFPCPLPARCQQQQPPSAAILGCPPPHHSPLNAGSGGRCRRPNPAAHVPNTTLSPHTAAASAGRDPGAPPPPSTANQCWQRQPPPAATLGRLPHPYPPLNFGRGGRPRPPYTAVALPKTTRSRLAEAAATQPPIPAVPPPEDHPVTARSGGRNGLPYMSAPPPI